MSQGKNLHFSTNRKIKEKVCRLIKQRISSISKINQLREKSNITGGNTTVEAIALLVWTTGVNYGMMKCMQDRSYEMTAENLKRSFNKNNKYFMKKKLIIFKNILKLSKLMKRNVNEVRWQRLRDSTILLWSMANNYGVHKICLINRKINDYSIDEFEKKLFSFNGRSNESVPLKYRFVKNRKQVCYSTDNEISDTYKATEFLIENDKKLFGLFTSDHDELKNYPSSMETIESLMENLNTIQNKIQSLRESIELVYDDYDPNLKDKKLHVVIEPDQKKSVHADENKIKNEDSNTNMDENNWKINRNEITYTENDKDEQVEKDINFLLQNHNSITILENMDWNLNLAELEIINLLLHVIKQNDLIISTDDNIIRMSGQGLNNSLVLSSKTNDFTSEIKNVMKLCKCFTTSISLIKNKINVKSINYINRLDEENIIDKIKYIIISDFCFNHLCPMLLNVNEFKSYLINFTRKNTDCNKPRVIRISFYDNNRSETQESLIKDSLKIIVTFKSDPNEDTNKIIINRNKVLNELSELCKNNVNKICSAKKNQFLILKDSFASLRDSKLSILKFINSYINNKINIQNGKIQFLHKIKRILNFIVQYFLKSEINIYLFGIDFQKLRRKKPKNQGNEPLKNFFDVKISPKTAYGDDDRKTNIYEIKNVKSRALALPKNSLSRSTIGEDVFRELCNVSDGFYPSTSNVGSKHKLKDSKNTLDSQKPNDYTRTFLEKKHSNVLSHNFNRLHSKENINDALKNTGENSQEHILIDSIDLNKLLKYQSYLSDEISNLRVFIKREDVKINGIFLQLDDLNKRVDTNIKANIAALENLYENLNNIQEYFGLGLTSGMKKMRVITLQQKRIENRLNKKIKRNSKTMSNYLLNNNKLQNMLNSEIILNNDGNKEINTKLKILQRKLNKRNNPSKLEIKKEKRNNNIFQKRVKIKMNETIRRIKLLDIKFRYLEDVYRSQLKGNTCELNCISKNFKLEGDILNKKMLFQEETLSNMAQKINNIECWLIKVIKNIKQDTHDLSNRLNRLENNQCSFYNHEKKISNDVIDLKNKLHKNLRYILKFTSEVKSLKQSIMTNRCYVKNIFDDLKMNSFDTKSNTIMAFNDVDSNNNLQLLKEGLISDWLEFTKYENKTLRKSIRSRRDFKRTIYENIKRLSSNLDIAMSNVETKIKTIRASRHSINFECNGDEFYNAREEGSNNLRFLPVASKSWLSLLQNEEKVFENDESNSEHSLNELVNEVITYESRLRKYLKGIYNVIFYLF